VIESSRLSHFFRLWLLSVGSTPLVAAVRLGDLLGGVDLTFGDVEKSLALGFAGGKQEDESLERFVEPRDVALDLV
jgi:hypothetical protein